MTKQSVTIHRALSELKIIDDRITRQLTELIPVGTKQKDKRVNGYYEEVEFIESAKAGLQSVQDLIVRKNVLKNAIVNSNAVTQVKVGDVEMSVADAINFKSLIEYKKNLADTIDSGLRSARATLEKNNAKVEEVVQTLLEAALGKDNVKTGTTDVDSIRDPFMEKNEWSIVDPLDAEKLVSKLRDEIDGFSSDVDAVLSESNAITLIEV